MKSMSLRYLPALLILLIAGACKPQKTRVERSFPRPVAPSTTQEGAPPTSTTPKRAELPKEPPGDLLPKDPAVRYGVLPNGMTFYIRSNAKPENRADLRLVVNSGSLNEDDDQQGLAHFLEHMAFNGTKNFEKKALVDYLQKMGMKFGAHVNAYTSFEETVYFLRAPTDDPEILDTSLQILEDWAGGITLDPEEIDKERGVVIEEWRLSLGAQSRVQNKQIPLLFKGARHPDRMPIGKNEILETAPQEAFQRYYQRWYRPDLMAVVAVGDFNAEEMEQKIREQFKDLPRPLEPANRPSYDVPDHEETLFAAITDPELTQSNITIYYKHPKKPSGTYSSYRQSLVSSLAETMLNRRLIERAREAEPPYISAYTGQSSLALNKNLVVQSASIKEGDFRQGLVALLEESRRVEQHGFTQTELEREKADLLRSIAKAYEERDKTSSAAYAGEYQRNFLNGESFPGIEVEKQLFEKFLPTITLDEVNRFADGWFTTANRVIFVTAPEREDINLPTQEDIYSMIAEVEQKDLPAFEDQVVEKNLLEAVPTPGSIVESSRVEDMNITEWRLSNGIRVILKPTDFKNDQIIFNATSPGGNSLVPVEQYIPAVTTTSILSASGIGEFNATQLEKKLQDKRVGVSPFISDFSEGLSGGGSPKDMETLFQLIYLHFTAPNFSEQAFKSMQSRLKAMVANRMASPGAVFQNEITAELFGDHPRHQPMSAALLEKMNLQQSEAIFRERFADASDFLFVFVGNFTPEAMKPLVETYLGSLPNLNRNETWKDTNEKIKPGKKEVTVHKGLEQKASVQLIFHGPGAWTSDNRLHLSALNDIIKIRLYDTLREEKGGTYGVSVSGSISKEPKEAYVNQISFGCSPENVDELVGLTLKELKNIAANGVEESYLVKMRETKLRSYEESSKNNGFWVSNLAFVYEHGFDPKRLLVYNDRVKAITMEDIRKAAQTFYNQDNMLEAVLYPAKAAE